MIIHNFLNPNYYHWDASPYHNEQQPLFVEGPKRGYCSRFSRVEKVYYTKKSEGSIAPRVQFNKRDYITFVWTCKNGVSQLRTLDYFETYHHSIIFP